MGSIFRGSIPGLLLRLAVFVAASSTIAHAAAPSELQYYSLGMAEGLANSSVYCILQDRKGFLWFGTFGGLSRYDGEGFTTYRPVPKDRGLSADLSAFRGESLAASIIFALLEDSSGSIWIGTDGGGLARYEEASDSFTLFRADPSNGRAPSSDRIFTLAEDKKGRLWAGTGEGSIDRRDPSTGLFRRFSPSELPSGKAPVRCLLSDTRGRLWAGTEGGGLLLFDEATERFGSFRHRPGEARSLGSDVVRSLYEDSRGRIWIGLGSGGVDLLDGDAFLHTTVPAGATAPAEAVRSLCEDPDGGIWVGWADSGLGLLDPVSRLIRPPSAVDAAMVRSIFRDRGGLMWVGLKEGGIRAFNLRSALFRRYRSRGDGKPFKDLRGLAQDREGRILAGTDGGGLLVVDPASGTVLPLPGMPAGKSASKVYTVLAARDGTIWAGTDGGGLIALKEGRSRTFKHDARDEGSLASDVVWALFEDFDGALWVGTEGGGLDRLDPRTLVFGHHRPSSTDGSAIAGTSIRTVFRDSSSRLWVGAWDGGLSRLDPGATRFTNYGPGSDSRTSLGDASVNCIFEDSAGTIWVGTGGSGLAKLDPASGRFVHFTEAEGLAGATVHGILEDRQGILWISTATGLSRYDRRREGYFNYGSEDGLASGELAQNSFLIARDGTLWFGGRQGLTGFDPSRLPAASSPPPVVITGLDGPGQEVLKGAGGAMSLSFDFRNEGFAFRVAVLDFVAPLRNRYAMRLEGRKEDWTYLGFHNSGYIGPLAPGRYLLRVKGSNGNGVWNNEGSTLAIEVKAPFWDQWWFRFVAATVLALLVLSLITARLGALRRRNELLVGFSRHIETAREDERIAAAREVHDEIGQHLAALNLQSYWLGSHLDAPLEQRKERLDEMGRSLGDAMSAVKSIATNLRPIALDALSLEEAFRWYLRSFERRSGIRARLEIGEGLPHVEGELATTLFRLLQEILTNVLRHSGAAGVEVAYSIQEDFLVLEVVDDGKGIEPGRAEAADSFGIIGMRERCAMYGGDLSVSSAPGMGTRVSARIPAASAMSAGQGHGARRRKNAQDSRR